MRNQNEKNVGDVENIDSTIIDPKEYDDLIVWGAKKDDDGVKLTLIQKTENADDLKALLIAVMRRLIQQGGKGNVMTILKIAAMALSMAEQDVDCDCPDCEREREMRMNEGAQNEPLNDSK